MNVYLVINKILQLFMMIVLGFILGKMKDFDESFIDKMNRFVLNITMPCLIISSVSANKNGIPYQDLFLSMIILIIILPIFAYLCLKISSLKDKSLYLFMIIYPNVGFIGFPLLQSLFGKQSLLLTALINMPFNLSLFTLGMMIMSNNRSEEHTSELQSPS